MLKSSQLVKESIVPFNPVIAGGIANEQFKDLEEYVNMVFMETAASFPPELKYNGYRRCTPDEEVKFILEKTQGKTSSRTVEIAKSSVYLMCYEFQFNDKIIHHHIYLPFIERGSQLYIRGTRYTIVPVMTAPVFSVEKLKQRIFVKLLVNKISFTRLLHTVVCNGIEIQLPVVHGKIHGVNPKHMSHWDEKKDESVNMQHATALYLFCHYGVIGSFKKYCKVDTLISIGEIDYGDKDPSHFVEFKSRRRKPTTVKTKYYEPHDVVLAIPKTHENDVMTLSLIGSFYYIADTYSQFMTDPSEFEDVDFWRVILGKVCFRMKDTIGVLLTHIKKHMDFVAIMLDTHMINDLHRVDIKVDNMVDFLGYIIENFSNILHNEDGGSLYDKKLLILRNVLEELIIGINKILFKTSSAKALRERSVLQDIGRHLVFDAILSLSKQPYCKVVLAPSDCMMMNHTNQFLMQNDISVKSKNSAFSVANPDKHLHASIMEIGSYLVVKDGEPTGRQSLNPYQVTGRTGITRRNPKLKKTIQYIEQHIER